MLIYNISIEMQDFLPFAGPFIYQNRNWNQADERGERIPQSYGIYFAVLTALGLLDFTTGSILKNAVVEGLKTLIK
ncbi:hypothetical protein A3K63_04315 [Candidatus Micrarchaeota archaeon RBG_16_49_10]|nr:MAG: hypothetical protein A3K63_04315 [Candidatus Micrarchaeota archaeon RBG_16_49_10]